MKKGNIKKWLKDRTEMLCKSIVLCILLSFLQGVSASSSLIDHALNSDIDKVKEAINQGEDINAQDGIGNTALIWAVKNGDIDMVKYLCEQSGINLNLQDKDKNTALIWAAKKGYTAIVEHLCQQDNIDMTIKNDKKETALIWIAYMKNDQVDLVTSLCQENNTSQYINWQDDEGYTALTIAYYKKNEKIKNYLMSHEKSDKNITFISAARTGQLEFVKLLLKDYTNDIDINVKDKDGNTALIWAVKNNHTEIVEYLCNQKDINIELKNNNNETALIWVACMEDDQVKLVKLLCEKVNTSEYINWQDDDGYTALTIASYNSNQETKNYLLKHKKINKNINFISAARTEQLKLVKLLLKKYVNDTEFDINAKDSEGNTALIWAVRNGYTAIVEHLCQQDNIDMTIKNDDNETALNWMAYKKGDNIKFVKLLCPENSAADYLNLQDHKGYNALICAASTGNTKIVKYLCAKKHINLNLQTQNGYTALTIAHHKKKENIKNYLLNHKKTNKSITLISAARTGQVELVKLLLKNYTSDININAKDNDGNTALIWAARRGYIDIVKYLCDQPNINIKAKGEYNDTAITWAAYNGHIEIVKFLYKEKGIDINTKGQGGKTVLICAAINGHVGIIDYLSNLPEIKPNLQDNQGDTAFSWTAYNGHEKCIDSLRKYSDIDPKIANYEGDTPIHRAAKGAKDLTAKDYKSTYKKLIDAGIDTQQENNHGEKAIDLVEDNELKTILREYVPKKPDSTDIDNSDKTDDNINADRTPEGKSYTGTIIFIALLLTTGSLIAATLFFWPKNDTKSKKDTVHGAKHNSKNKDEKPKNSSNPKAIQVA